MYTAVVLMCIGLFTTYENCYTQTNTNIFQTKDECMYAIYEGILLGNFEIRDPSYGDHEVRNFYCINWNERET